MSGLMVWLERCVGSLAVVILNFDIPEAEENSAYSNQHSTVSFPFFKLDSEASKGHSSKNRILLTGQKLVILNYYFSFLSNNHL